LAGVAANLTIEAGEVTAARLAFCAAGPTPMRAVSAETAVTGQCLTADTIRTAQASRSKDLDPFGDDEMPAATRLHLARVLLGRVLAALGQGA
jgi:carbon-monoxide dehydrogenase medium subunit